MAGLTAQDVSVSAGVSVPVASVALVATNVSLPSTGATLNTRSGNGG